MASRRRINPGKYGAAHSLLLSHVVEVEATEDRFGGALSTYTVYMDGEAIGELTSRRERQHTHYKGTVIRKDLGNPVRWRYTLSGRIYGPHISGLAHESRTSAAAALVRDELLRRKRVSVFEAAGLEIFGAERFAALRKARYGTEDYTLIATFERDTLREVY